MDAIKYFLCNSILLLLIIGIIFAIFGWLMCRLICCKRCCCSKKNKDKQAPQPSEKSSNIVEEKEDVKHDEALGLVYNKKPSKEDDLTQIKGVAKVLKTKLNDFGIYTFKQIAVWNKTNMDEFSQRLNFKNRIKRDNWVDQAKKFHKDKYGEDL